MLKVPIRWRQLEDSPTRTADQFEGMRARVHRHVQGSLRIKIREVD